ncbi:helix-turn-helix transcriptional regulator [Nocardioides sp. YIM 152315]|uniref:helix-turn-helix domain-containing protein n=1 Tax=Nocardioides sp. YIM 152315 TaxID=3031760 RepID=UPI0023D9D1BC|nr:helix-turn-helix transcriptional regulator [Nocardioides sp. YIM 152315]MDF1605803.1 helix-turn-helix transcriptional regulator [Nocardioides sp. YIM 152315]
MTVTTEMSVGELVRRWRDRRGRSQLDLSIAADLSARHLSFIETGRSRPSREMIERLCNELDVPLRERNALHLAAGFAPAYPERPLADLGVARTAIETVLAGHEPSPALAVNVRWELLSANRAMRLFLDDLAADLLEPPINVLRATLHPEGLAPRIRNYEEWRTHAVRRVRRQLERTAADGLADLLSEIEAYPVPPSSEPGASVSHNDLVAPMRLATDDGELAFHYALTVFGAARDVTLDEIAIETFFPADDATTAAVKNLMERTGDG